MPWWLRIFPKINLGNVLRNYKIGLEFIGKEDLYKYVDKEHLQRLLCPSQRQIPDGCPGTEKYVTENFENVQSGLDALEKYRTLIREIPM